MPSRSPDVPSPALVRLIGCPGTRQPIAALQARLVDASWQPTEDLAAATGVCIELLDLPDRFYPPKGFPPATLEVRAGGTLRVSYAPGFRGRSAETGVELAPLTVGGWSQANPGSALRTNDELATLLEEIRR